MFTPLNPKKFPLLNPVKLLPLASHEANLFNLCPFPDSPVLFVQYLFPIGPAVSPLFPGFWIVDPLNPRPQIPQWGIVGRIVLAYVHSQMNPQTCTEFGVNRSIRLVAFPDLNLWPPKPPPPEMSPVVKLVLRGELHLAMSIPRRIRRHVPNVVPIVRAVWQLPLTFECLAP